MTNQEIKSGSKVAYRRCSTDDTKQDVARQLFGMDFDKEFVEYASGSSVKGRPVFQECLEYVQAGDSLYFADMSRAARNASELLVTVEMLIAKGVNVIFVSEGLTFTDSKEDAMKSAMSKMMLTMLSAVNELFLTQNSVAVKSGMKRAKAEGKKFGAASPNYNRTNSVSKKTNTAAKSRTEAVSKTIRLLMSVITRPTCKSIADALTKSDTLLPSGVLGTWTATQVSRVCIRHEIVL